MSSPTTSHEPSVESMVNAERTTPPMPRMCVAEGDGLTFRRRVSHSPSGPPSDIVTGIDHLHRRRVGSSPRYIQRLGGVRRWE